MTAGPLPTAHRLLAEALDGLAAAAGPGAADAELLSVLTICEGAARRLDRLVVATVAAVARRGVFAARGYVNPAHGLADLLGWDRAEARRRVVAAEQVCARIGLDGAMLPPRLPATAAVFAAGRVSLRHVEVLAKALDGPAAGRLAPEVWAGAEAELADKATRYRPAELTTYARRLIELLDADGPAPDEDEPHRENVLYANPHPDRPGGRLRGRFDDAALFDAITTALDALSAPTAEGGERDPRGVPQRQAEALAELCAHALDQDDLPPWRATPPPQRARAPGGPGGPCPLRGARLRRPAHPRRAAEAGRRRRGDPDRAERGRAAPRRRAAHPHHSRRAAPRRRRPRRRLRLPRLRPARLLVRLPPHPTLAGRRPHHPGQPGDAVQAASSAGPPLRLDGAPPRRAARIPPTPVDRPGPEPSPKTTPPPDRLTPPK
nr:DUF222 domain-containing protein [Pseudonocardia asaccharolytica]